MDKENGKEQLTTLDAYLAGFLSLHGHEPRLIEQGGKIAFSFDSSHEVKALLQKFNLGATVVASQLVFQIKSLKSRIHEMRREKGQYRGTSSNW